MSVENYFFMKFVLDYNSFFITGTITIFGILFGLRSQKPKAFGKIKNDILPSSWFLLSIFTFISIFIAVRIFFGVISFNLIGAIEGGEILDEKTLDAIQNSLRAVREMARVIDLILFLGFALLTIEKALSFIDWLLKEDET